VLCGGLSAILISPLMRRSLVCFPYFPETFLSLTWLFTELVSRPASGVRNRRVTRARARTPPLQIGDAFGAGPAN
jgi:hypothetical protein